MLKGTPKRDEITMAFIDLNSDVGAVLHDEDAVAANMARTATEGTVVARDGSAIKTTAESICLNGDTQVR